MAPEKKKVDEKELFDFENFWEYISELLVDEQEIGTVRGTSFRCRYDSEYDAFVVKPKKTNMPRDVTKGDFSRVWERFMEVREEEEYKNDLFRPALYQRITRNASYILPLLRKYHEEVVVPGLSSR